ncbi:metal-dependent hydrolase [Natronobiforma cellulositropha]|uniref:metal-dependent hydrolase n=1 Tax=Natronobiforma cellulositropha TaxID=1679076 RepID=UPI0021D604CA|nr:metal-dependent hydrolase [Natronobiforma cellulositropha]
MYRPGHYGVALLVYAPLGFVVASAGYEPAAIVGCVTVLALSTLPDYDQRVPALEHRGPTHTFAFAALVGVALAGVAALLVGEGVAFAGLGVVGFAFAVGSLSILSHLLADALTPAGIRPFWPLSNRRYSVSLTRASNVVANYALLGLGLAVALLAAVLAISY